MRRKRVEPQEPPPQASLPQPPPEPPCTPEENRAGLAMLRAAIYGKQGPMAKTVASVCRRLNSEGKPGDEIPF